MKIYCILISILAAGRLLGQVAINHNGAPCDSSAILDVKSTTRGLLIPRMTLSQRNNIPHPANGLMIFCTENGRIYLNQGTANTADWVMLADSETFADSLNDRYRRSDTSQVLLSRLRAGHDFESLSNKSTDPNLGSSNLFYPTQNAVKMYVNSVGTNYIANSSSLQPANFHITGNGWIQGGNLGVGTPTAPGYLLDISGSSNVLRINTLPINSANTSVLVIDDATGVVAKRTGSFTSGTVTAVTATTPVASSGGNTPNITISQAGTGTSGFLSSTDWNLFNGKESVLTFNAPLTRSSNSVSVVPATSAQNGYLSGADYARLHGTAGSLVFYDANGLQQDNASLFFDNANNRLGVGTSTPVAMFSAGNASQFQVAPDGKCSVSGPYGSSPAISGTNTTGTGLSGTGSVYGVYGQCAGSAGERAGGYFYTNANAYARVGGYKQTSPGVYEAYLIWGVGKLVTQSISSDGDALDLYATVSPGNRLTEYGSGRLRLGRCHIEIPPSIAKRLRKGTPGQFMVFIQLEDDCNGVFVSNKSEKGFDVTELKGGTSDAAFSWSLTADLAETVVEVSENAQVPGKTQSNEKPVGKHPDGLNE